VGCTRQKVKKVVSWIVSGLGGVGGKAVRQRAEGGGGGRGRKGQDASKPKKERFRVTKGVLRFHAKNKQAKKRPWMLGGKKTGQKRAGQKKKDGVRRTERKRGGFLHKKEERVCVPLGEGLKEGGRRKKEAPSEKGPLPETNLQRGGTHGGNKKRKKGALAQARKESNANQGKGRRPEEKKKKKKTKGETGPRR